MISETEFALLNAVFLKKVASLDEIADITAIPLETADELAAKFHDGEALISTPGGLMIMPVGTDLVLAYYRDRYAATRSDPMVKEWYERFEVLNARFIAAISDWQRSERDPAALEKVVQIVERLMQSIEQLLRAVPRYEGYNRRFQAAIDRIDAGDTAYVSSPMKDSVHNVWFEFHEDVLAVLGRPRDTT